MADFEAAKPVAEVRPAFLNEDLSIYLDAVRLLAALAVLIGHLDQDGMHAGWMVLGAFSHEAVVVFFVLSGLVISHVTRSGRGDWRTYLTARAARIYSVVLPAALLSFAVKYLAVRLDPSLAPEFWTVDMTWNTLAGSLLFMAESWGIGGLLPWNVPIWSLCYEVWYYVVFGLLCFAPTRWRWGLVLLACLIAGPAILLLFPIWLLGAWLSRIDAEAMGVGVGAMLWVASVAAMLTLDASGLSRQIQQSLYDAVPGYWRLVSSQRFVTDYLWGLLIAANFIGFRGLAPAVRPLLVRMERPLVLAAGFTFSLYLYHRPMTEFIGHFAPNLDQSKLVSVGWLFLVVSLCVLLGAFTELRKQVLRNWIAASLGVGRRRST